VENEKIILKQEQKRYLQRVQNILNKGEKADSRDILELALGLKNYAEKGSIKGSIFEGHGTLLAKVLYNKKLLELVMVACGKVLIASPSNDRLIDLLRSKNINVNSVDKDGMTALHYAVQNFYDYRAEQLNLIKKLLDCGADPEPKDKTGPTPLELAKKHSQDKTVVGGPGLLELLRQRPTGEHSVNSDTTEYKNTPSQAIIFRALGCKPGEQRTLAKEISSQDDSSIQTKAEEKRKNEQPVPAPTERKATDDSNITYSTFRKR
jgi:ankyrin repeat protein